MSDDKAAKCQLCKETSTLAEWGEPTGKVPCDLDICDEGHDAFHCPKCGGLLDSMYWAPDWTIS